MLKKVAVGTLVGLIVLFALGFLTYGVILKNALAAQATAAGTCMNMEPDFVTIICSTLAQALLIAWVLAKCNVATFGQGFITTGILIFLVALSYNLWFLSAYPYYTTQMAATDLVAATVQSAIGGGVVGWVLGRVK